MSDEQSAFNEASYQLMRLHQLWELCHQHSMRGELDKLRWTLDRVGQELAIDAVRINGNNLDEFTQWNQKNPYLRQLSEIDDAITTAHKGRDKAKLYAALKLKEQYLRAIQDGAGKGGKYVSPSEDEME